MSGGQQKKPRDYFYVTFTSLSEDIVCGSCYYLMSGKISTFELLLHIKKINQDFQRRRLSELDWTLTPGEFCVLLL